MQNVMKKIYIYILAVLFAVLSSANTAMADATYKITQTGQADVTGNFTTWAAFMDVLKVHSQGTEENRVIATISGATISNTGRPDIQGWVKGFLFRSDNLAYTTLKFENCTFSPISYPGLGFERAGHNGNILRFDNCTFGDYSFWGVNMGDSATGTYSYDFEFYNCDINNLGGGGVWYGDVTVEDCKLSATNLNCGYEDTAGAKRFLNSFDEPSTLTVKNVEFKNTDAGDRGVYANSFRNYVYQKASSDNHLYSIRTNGYQGDFSSHPEDFHYELINSTGNIEFSSEGIYSGLYVITGYAVKYYPNGGEGTVVDGNNYVPGDKATILANGFTRSGYAFTGWNTKEDGTGTSYAAGQEVEIPFYTLKLYAQWVEAPQTLYAVKVKCNGLDENESAHFAVYLNGSTLLNIINISGDKTSRMVTSKWFTPGATCTVGLWGNWSWKYNIALTKKTTEVSEKGRIDVYEFTATKKDNITTKHGESLKVNELEGKKLNPQDTEMEPGDENI